MSENTNVFFEFRRPGGELCHFPLQVKSLSGKGAILEGSQLPEGVTVDNLAGREGLLLILGQDKADDLELPGKILWARSDSHQPADYQISLEFPDLSPRARRALERQLPKYPRDIKEFWEAYDQVHHASPSPKGDQAFYLVGLAAVAGGLALYFTLSGNARIWGSIVAIYGSLMMAGKSLWSMWRKTVSGKQ